MDVDVDVLLWGCTCSFVSGSSRTLDFRLCIMRRYYYKVQWASRNADQTLTWNDWSGWWFDDRRDAAKELEIAERWAFERVVAETLGRDVGPLKGWSEMIRRIEGWW